jgi:UDP-2,3-diacylglucosamine hydrolase
LPLKRHFLDVAGHADPHPAELCRAFAWTGPARFDVPTIALGTIKTLSEAGARVLAVEAGRTILLDGPEVIDEADRQGIAVVAVDEIASRP